MKIKNTETGQIGHVDVKNFEIPKILYTESMFGMTYEEAVQFINEELKND